MPAGGPPSIPRASLAFVGEGNFVLDATPEDLAWSPHTISVAAWLRDPQRQSPLSQGAFCDLRYLDLTGLRRDSADFSLCLSGVRFFLNIVLFCLPLFLCMSVFV